MVDKAHTMMNIEDFEEEYEPFYDFSGTYEENFVGKIIDDFDLTEEMAAWPVTQVDPQPIAEVHKEDDDWEDIDAEDAMAEGSSNSDFTLISDQNKDAPQSASSFTLISQ